MKKTERTLQWLLCIALSVFFFVMLVLVNLKKAQSMPAMVIFSAVWIALLALEYALVSAAQKHLKRSVLCALCVVGFTCMLALQIYMASALYTKIGWDVGLVFNEAQTFFDGGEIAHSYLYIYPNNSLLYMLDLAAIAVGSALGVAEPFFLLVLLNIVAVDAACMLTCFCARRFFGSRSMRVALVLCVPLMALNPWITTPYTDTLTLFTVPALMLLYGVTRDAASVRRRVLSAVCFGVCAGFAYLLKPTMIVMPIAVAITALVVRLSEKNKTALRKAGVSALCALCAFAVLLCGFNALRPVVLDGLWDDAAVEEEAYPYTHYIMMGLSVYDEAETYGGWHGEDITATAARLGQAAKKEYNLSVIKERLAGFGGVFGYAEFLTLKARMTFMDGTFTYGGEGGHYQSDPPSSNGAKLFQSFFFPSGQYHEAYVTLADSLWFMLLAVFALSAFNRQGSYQRRRDLALIRLCVLGLILFLMIFETRSRYLMCYMPAFILWAASTVPEMYGRMKNGSGK